MLGCILFDLSEVVEANPKENVIKGLEAEYKPIIRSLLGMVISEAWVRLVEGHSLRTQYERMEVTKWVVTNSKI